MTQNLGHESNQHWFRNFTDMKGMLRMIAEKILGIASPDRSRRMVVHRMVISGGNTHTHTHIHTQRNPYIKLYRCIKCLAGLHCDSDLEA